MKQVLYILFLLSCFQNQALCQNYQTGIDLGNGIKTVYQTISTNNRFEEAKKIYGITNSSGKLILPIAYQEISKTAEKNIVEIKDSKMNVGLFSTLSEKFIVEPVYYDIKSFSDGLAVVLKRKENNGFYWGAVDAKGKMIIPAEYEYLGLCKEGLINFKKDGKFGYLDKRNSIIIPATYYNMSNFNEGLAPVRITNEAKYGYIDKNNKLVITPKYVAAYDFYQGYAKVAIVNGYRSSRVRRGTIKTVESEFMLINKKGMELFDSTYHNISFRQAGGLFVVELDNNKGVLDSTGKILLPVKYRDAEFDKEGNIIFKKTSSGTLGLMNSKGVEILKPQYDYISHATNGHFYSKKRGDIAVWNTSGKQLIPPDSAAGIILGKTRIVIYYYDGIKIFDGNGKLIKTITDHRYKTFGHKLSEKEDSLTLNVDQTAYLVNLSKNSKKGLQVSEVGDFNEDGIFIGKDKDYYFYDYTGKELNTEGFYAAVNFSEGICAVQRSSKSSPYLADKNFKKIKDLTVTFSGPYSEGLAFASNSSYGKLYYLDKTGNEAFSVSAKEGGACNEGFIILKSNANRYYHVNKKGKAVGTKTWEEVGNFSEGVARVKNNGKWGFIDTAGNVVIELKYDIVSDFTGGTAVVKSGNEYFLINQKDQKTINEKYEGAGNPGNGTFPLRKNGKVGIVDSRGKPIIDFKYKNIIYITENRSWALKDSTWGLVDDKGKELTGFVYDAAYNFKNDFAQVKLKDKMGLVNKSGKLVLPAIYKSIGTVYKNTVICLKPAETITVSIR